MYTEFKYDLKDVSVFDDPIWQWRQTVQHKKKIPDQVSVCTQREDRKWSMRWRAWLVGFVNCQEFSQVDCSSQAKAVVADESEFVLYLCTSGEKQDEERYGPF